MADIKSNPLILICGPTGVGKSDMAVSLCHAINGEVISADSVQVYKGLDIGSAKIFEEETQGITHHLIDILNPDEEFGVHIFQKLAIEAIQKIYSKGKIPVIVGGTAFYIQALLYNIDFTEESEPSHEFRDNLIQNTVSENDAIELWNRLNKIDPEYAKTTHYNNIKRVARALEYNHNTGRLFSEYNKEQKERESDYNYLYIALTDDREKLYARIDKRVDIMIQNGLIDEIKALRQQGYNSSLNSMSSIGYKEIGEYLDGLLSLDDAISYIKKNSRHYAKRQLTWLRHEKDVHFFDRSEYQTNRDIVDAIISLAMDKNIITGKSEA